MPSYVFFGWVNAAVLGLMVLPFGLLSLNKRFFKSKHPSFLKAIRWLRKLHKPLGLVFVGFALIHGWMALGAFRLHTGWLLYISLALTAFAGGAFHRLKKKRLFQTHRLLALITVLLFALHYLWPWVLR